MILEMNGNVMVKGSLVGGNRDLTQESALKQTHVIVSHLVS